MSEIAALLNYLDLEWVDLRDSAVKVTLGSAASAVVERLRQRGVEVRL